MVPNDNMINNNSIPYLIHSTNHFNPVSPVRPNPPDSTVFLRKDDAISPSARGMDSQAAERTTTRKSPVETMKVSRYGTMNRRNKAILVYLREPEALFEIKSAFPRRVAGINIGRGKGVTPSLLAVGEKYPAFQFETQRVKESNPRNRILAVSVTKTKTHNPTKKGLRRRSILRVVRIK
jgi:hypothetical protein